MSAKPTGDGPGVEESDKNLDGATGGGKACNRDRYRREDRVRVGQRVDEQGRDPSTNPGYMYGSNEEAILDPYRLSLHLIAGFGEGITLQHAVDRLFDHLSTGFRPICVAESHRHQHHHRRPRRTRKPRTGYPPLHVQVFLMPKELGMSCRLLSRPPWRLRHWHLPPGAPQRGVRLYTLSDLPAPLWSVVEAQGGHPMLRFVVNASHDTFSAACRLYTELLLGGESRDLGLIGNEEAIRSIAALNNIAELNESMVDEKIAGNYSQEYTRRFAGLNAESKKKSNILDRQHDGQRNNRHGSSNSSTLMNDHVKACGQLNGVGKADGDGSDRRLTGDEGCRKSCGLSPSRDRTSQPSQDGGEWSRFASGFEGFSCMAVTVTPSLLVQLAVQRLPIGVQPGRSPCALLEVRVPGSELGRFVPLLPSSCQPISATRWQTRDHDGNKILLQTNSVPVQLGPEPWLSLPVDGADGDTICSLPTSPAPTPSLRPNCQSLPASPGPSLPCCSPALSPTHSPTRSPEQNTPCRCRPHSYISVSTHQSPPQSPTHNFISQKSSLSPPYQSLPHHSSNRAQLFSAHRRHHCSLTANRPTSPRLSSTYGASHPSKLLHDPSTKRPSRQIISHLSCHGQPSANGQQQMENRTESRDKAPPSQQPGQAAGRNVLAENTLKEGQKEAEEQEFFI